MKRECFICGDSHIKFLMEKDGHRLWHCKKCGLNFIHPQPSKKKLQEVYSLEGGYSHSNKGFDVKSSETNRDSRVNFLVKNKKRNVLDVGCASGYFVHNAKFAGLDAVGIDLDADSIKFGQKLGLDLKHGRLNEMGFKNASFDAINLGDVIEHVKNPRVLLKECLRILKNDGILIISTPNTNSLFPKITKWVYENFGITWSHPTPPYHLFDFSDENLELLLNKIGLKIEHTTYSKSSLSYSIYHTGYFNNIRKNINGQSGGNIIAGVIKSFSPAMFLQVGVAFVYSIAFVADKIFGENGCQMIIYSIKK